MRVAPVAALLLVLAGCTPTAGTTSPGPSSTPVDPCGLPVEQRTGGWLCPGEPSPAAQQDAPMVVPRAGTPDGSGFPGLLGSPDDVTLVEICSDRNDHECRTLSRHVDPARDRVLSLARAMATATLSPSQSTVCRTGTGEELTVRALRAEAAGASVRIRVGCRDIWVGATRYRVEDDVEQLVRQAYQTPPWAGVATLVDQCVGDDRAQPLPQLVGLTSLEARQRLREQGLEVLLLGAGSDCRSGQSRPYEDGRMVLVVGDGDIVLWANRG